MDDTCLSVPTNLLQIISSDQAWHYGIVPKRVNGTYVEFYVDEIQNLTQNKDELELLLGKEVKLHLSSHSVISKTLAVYYKNTSSNTNRIKLSSPGENFLDDILNEATRLDCSDIHIELYENIGRVRYRVDGRLFERFTIKKEEYPSISNRIKILANLDIAEKRLPQDGRILLKSQGESLDLRVSVIPALFGEKIVLRLLSKSAKKISLESLGLRANQKEDYLRGVRKPHGIILVSGPTGSGKTTTLYATLDLLNTNDVNILTIEDPIEYTLEGINQVQLRENIGLTFSSALRTFLRQDPDIIMLGEIRDPETAHMAIRASLTGHLVLSTIHTNSAWGVVERLLDMGIPPFLLSSTLNTAVAQRLVRKLCKNCRSEIAFDNRLIGSEMLKNYLIPKTHFVPVGCNQCHHSGYSGRVAVFEVININNSLRNKIRGSDLNNDASHIDESSSLALNSFEMFRAGITSLDEIMPILLSQE